MPLNVNDINLLAELKSTIGQFQASSQDSLLKIGDHLRREIDWVNSRISYWSQNLENSRQKLVLAQQDLDRCKSSRNKDQKNQKGASNCQCEEKAVIEAKSNQAKCNQNLMNAKAWKIKLEQALIDYRRVENEFQRLVTSDSSTAISQLAIYHSQYSAVHSSEKAISSSGGSVQASGNLSNDASGLPEQYGRKFQNINLSGVPFPEDIKGEVDFKKASLESMKAGFERFQEMKKTIEGGNGVSSDYWARVDSEKGLNYENGYQKVFEAFYGRDPIAVEIHNGEFNILSGRHRIWLGKTMGFDTLPMIVISEE